MVFAQKHHEEERIAAITEKIIAAVIEVSNELGIGFLEKVYERAMLAELRRCGLKARAQAQMPVSYKGELIGSYYADLLVEDEIIVELKCSTNFAPEHMAQCLNYLKASGLKIALLINFGGARARWKRVVHKL